MPLKVYGHPMSACTRRVLLMLEELQVPYDMQTLDLSAGEHKQPDYLKLQPFGKVPAMEDSDEGVTMFESRSILRYLGKKFVDNAPELFPKDLKQCAAVDTWLEVEAQNFNPPANALVAQLVLNPILGQPVDTDVVAKNVQILEEVLDVYEKKLAERPYIAGQHFSIADISHMPLTHLMIAAPTTRRLFDDRHYLHEWWKKISERPAWQRLNPKTQAGQQQAQK
eukprot:jgi/Chrzof1/9918/Cz04g20230.t1